jgi:DNA mismatch endonuclease (patch repair protein)
MSRQRSRDTAPEVLVRSLLHRKGLRFRVHAAPLADRRRTVDILFSGPRIAVLIDGCFWHRCPDHGSSPASNSEWWRRKLDRNVERDRDTDQRLVEAGWTVMRFWEHEDPNVVAASIEAAVLDHMRLGRRAAARSPET